MHHFIYTCDTSSTCFFRSGTWALEIPSAADVCAGPNRLADRSRSNFMTESQSVSMSWYRAPLWDLRQDIISCRNVAVWICGLVSMGRPLWQEDGTAICIVITQWSESLRTRNHTLLSHLRLSQPAIYIPHEQGGPVIPPGTELVPFTSSLRTRRATVEVF
jgi:hypothetical protein